MGLPTGWLAGAFACLIGTLPAVAQTEQQADAALAALEMRVTDAGREFRAVAPFDAGTFLVASFTLDGSATRAALHLVSETGEIGAPLPLPQPEGYAGSRIDRLVPVDGAVIAIGHVANGPEDRRGWILRIGPGLNVEAQTVLPLVAEGASINYYYGGFVDMRGWLIVGGRSDQPDFPGIGIRYTLNADGLLQVSLVQPGGPSGQAGVAQGDVLLRANGRELRGLDPQQMVAQLAGPIDAPLELTVERPGEGRRDFSIPRSMVRGVTTGVVTALNPRTLTMIRSPTPLQHSTTRAGFQDIAQMPDGRIVAAGWWESIAPDGAIFDMAWIVALDGSFAPQSDQQFGHDGADSIAHRLHLEPGGRMVVIGGVNKDPEPVAFASELTFDGPDGTARLTPVREWFDGPGASDVFRGITTLQGGDTIVAGAFRTDNAPRFQTRAMALGYDAAPRALYEGCAQSYVWDMASTSLDAIAVAGYCVEEDGTRRAALMWSPPARKTTGEPALSDAPRLPLQDTGNGHGFELARAEQVLVFVAPGAHGVLSLTDATGQLVDYAAVDAAKAGLLEVDLAPGRYVVRWTADGPGESPRIDVIKAALTAPDPGTESARGLTPDLATALSLLGYRAVSQDRQSRATLRDIAAYQLSRDLPALGHVDLRTEVALLVDGALQAESRGREFAMLGARLSQTTTADTLSSRFGPVAGQWRGDAFVGTALLNSMGYAGEWALGEDGLAYPSGFGRLDDRSTREGFVGSFEYGVFTGLGVRETARDVTIRQVGAFDESSRFTTGAIFERGQLTASGLFSPGGETVLRDVPLSR